MGSGGNRRGRTTSDTSDRANAAKLADRSRSKSKERKENHHSHSKERTSRKGSHAIHRSDTEEFEKVNSQQKNISVADIPAKQSLKIKNRLNGLQTKSALDKELQTSMNKLKKNLKIMHQM